LKFLIEIVGFGASHTSLDCCVAALGMGGHLVSTATRATITLPYHSRCTFSRCVRSSIYIL